jgi:hypothetical protein
LALSAFTKNKISRMPLFVSLSSMYPHKKRKVTGRKEKKREAKRRKD